MVIKHAAPIEGEVKVSVTLEAKNSRPKILFSLFVKAIEFVTFAILNYGRMAERLRQRSAKPSTPVRIRFRPPLNGSVSQ